MNSSWSACGDSARRPLSLRVCDAATLGFALWTVCCHGVVVAGGSLQHAVVLFGIAAGLALAAWIFARRPERETADDPGAVDPPAPAAWTTTMRVAMLPVAAVVAIGVSPEDHPVALWWITVGVLCCAAVPFVFAEEPKLPAPEASHRREAALWAVAIACAGLALWVHRPDIDDAFYVNVAVSAADAPDQPLLAGDTLIGVEGLPLHMPAHRLHTYELLHGALSYLTGIPVIYSFHWIAAGLVALAVPLAHARLFRLLTPRHWVWVASALVVVLVASGETHRSYGNFAFVRSWQGKSVYLFFFMPLVYAHGIRFALRPNPGTWLALAAAQIGALGCSSTAVWAAPAGAMMALCCGLRPTRRGFAVFGIGALASAYVLCAGWLLRGELQPMLAPEIRDFALGAQFDNALSHVFGSARLSQFAIASVLVAWACCGAGIARRFAIVFPLAVWLVLLNPYWDGWISQNVTGPSYWRVMWSLPAPILMALVLTAPLQFGDSHRRRVRTIGAAVAAVAVAAFAIGVPRFGTLSPRNGAAGGLGIWRGKPGVKIPPAAFQWAGILTRSVAPGSIVVAPPGISVWLSTFHERVFPLQARRLYLYRNATFLGSDDVELRNAMTRYVGGETDWDDPKAMFRYGLKRFRVVGVCLGESPLAQGARQVLEALDFHRTLESPLFEIWLRDSGDPASSPAPGS